MRIWLIRHGLTREGAERRYQGALDSPLCPEGKAALRRAQFSPDEVFVSPLLRARQTAEILFPEATLREIPDLREMDFGRFEGRSAKEMEQDEAYNTWVDGNCLGRCPGGEDRASFSARVCGAFASLLQESDRCERKELVIVAHGGTQMSLLETYGSPEREYYLWQTACGNGWLLETRSGSGRLHVVREVSFTT